MLIPRFFSLSLILNGVFVGVIGLMLIRSTPPPETRLVQAALTKVESLPQPVLKESPHSMTWNEIATSDCSVYIRNLRAFGCPERTIRWIIASELSLANQTTTMTQGADLGQLLPEQAEKLQQLLEGSPNPGNAQVSPRDATSDSNEGNSASPAQVTAIAPPQEEVNLPKMPLVFFAEQPNSGLVWVENQQVNLQSIKKSFTNQLGAQNPYDPTYLQQWMVAQPTSDDLFRVQFGDAAYGQMLMQRALQGAGDFHF